MRSQYHIIGPLKVANTTSSSGIWNLDDQQQAKSGGNWPGVSGGSSVTPTVEYLVVAGGAGGA